MMDEGMDRKRRREGKATGVKKQSRESDGHGF